MGKGGRDLTVLIITSAFLPASSGKLPFAKAPPDDRGLPDMHLALYDDVVVFDHATKLAYVIAWVHLDRHSSLDEVMPCRQHPSALCG